MIALGEAKWGQVDSRDAERLQRVARLLGDRIARDARLLLFGGRSSGGTPAGVERIGLDALYG